jgi:hypothetical protein
MGWMKEVWRLVNEEDKSYDEAVDIVAAQRIEYELQHRENERRSEPVKK